jgi:hypothetical protein
VHACQSFLIQSCFNGTGAFQAGCKTFLAILRFLCCGANAKSKSTRLLTIEAFSEVQSMIQRLKKQEIVSKAKTDKLKEGLRKDLHRFVIETEVLIAVAAEKAKLRAARAAK